MSQKNVLAPHRHFGRFSVGAFVQDPLQHNNKPVVNINAKIKDRQMKFQPPKYQFKAFDLSALRNFQLMRNPVYSDLLTKLEKYNDWLSKNGSRSLIQNKFYAFIYSTLEICLTKTLSECEILLKETDTWIKQHLKTRPKDPLPERKSNWIQGEERAVRQTFKSPLPLQYNYFNSGLTHIREGYFHWIRAQLRTVTLRVLFIMFNAIQMKTVHSKNKIHCLLMMILSI